jgi:hypothetical protein
MIFHAIKVELYYFIIVMFKKKNKNEKNILNLDE